MAENRGHLEDVEGEVAKSTAVVAAGEDRRVQWQARLKRFEQEGRSVTQFCAAEAVSKWAFYYWRRRLARRAQTVPRAAVARPRVGEVDAAGFIDAGVARLGASTAPPQMAPPAATSAVELRLELGGGVVLQVLRR